MRKLAMYKGHKVTVELVYSDGDGDVYAAIVYPDGTTNHAYFSELTFIPERVLFKATAHLPEVEGEFLGFYQVGNESDGFDVVALAKTDDGHIYERSAHGSLIREVTHE